LQTCKHTQPAQQSLCVVAVKRKAWVAGQQPTTVQVQHLQLRDAGQQRGWQDAAVQLQVKQPSELLQLRRQAAATLTAQLRDAGGQLLQVTLGCVPHM
jgi:hypothetical protein